MLAVLYIINPLATPVSGLDDVNDVSATRGIKTPLLLDCISSTAIDVSGLLVPIPTAPLTIIPLSGAVAVE